MEDNKYSHQTVRKIGLILLRCFGALIAVFYTYYSVGTPYVGPVLEVVEYNSILKKSDTSNSFLLTEIFIVEQTSLKRVRNAKWYIPDKGIILDGIIDRPGLNQMIGGKIEAINFPLTIIPSIKYTFVATRNLATERAGFLLRKCEFNPIPFQYKWSQSIEQGVHEAISSFSAARYASKSRIELELPKGSFFGANGKSEISAYGNVDIITWTLPFNLLQRDVGFVYLDPPVYSFGWLIKPFAGISSFGTFLVICIGLAISAFGVIPLLAFKDALKDKMLQILHSKTNKQDDKDKPKKKVKIIVSPSGEEKEIDVYKNESES